MIFERRPLNVISFRIRQVVVAAALFAKPVHAQDFALPDPIMTPGAIDPAATLDVI